MSEGAQARPAGRRHHGQPELRDGARHGASRRRTGAGVPRPAGRPCGGGDPEGTRPGPGDPEGGGGPGYGGPGRDRRGDNEPPNPVPGRRLSGAPVRDRRPRRGRAGPGIRGRQAGRREDRRGAARPDPSDGPREGGDEDRGRRPPSGPVPLFFHIG